MDFSWIKKTVRTWRLNVTYTSRVKSSLILIINKVLRQGLNSMTLGCEIQERKCHSLLQTNHTAHWAPMSTQTAVPGSISRKPSLAQIRTENALRNAPLPVRLFPMRPLKELGCQGASGEHDRFRPASAASLALGLVVALRFLGQQHSLDVKQTPPCAMSRGPAACWALHRYDGYNCRWRG